eukprot:jgi/Galph1/384/GphlegSOOS_G5133.1
MNAPWRRFLYRHRRPSRACIIAVFFISFALCKLAVCPEYLASHYTIDWSLLVYTLSSGSLYYHKYLRQTNLLSHLVSTHRLVTLVSSGWGTDHLVDIASSPLSVEYLNNLKQRLELLNEDKNIWERVAVSPFMVLKMPDFDWMKVNQCPSALNCSFQGKNLLKDEQVIGALRSLFTNGFIHPEFGGQVGFNLWHWLQELQEGAENVQALSKQDSNLLAVNCFLNNKVCSLEPDQESNEFLYFETEHHLTEWIKYGTDEFYQQWGYYPSVLALSDHNLGPSLMDIFRRLGYFGIHVIPQEASDISLYRNLDRRISVVSDIYLPATEHECLSWLERHWSSLEDMEYLSIRVPPSLLFSPLNNNTISCVHMLVKELRERDDTLFLTSSEWHQILHHGWSKEIWHEYVVLRNFLETFVVLPILQIDQRNSLLPTQKKPIVEMLCANRSTSSPLVLVQVDSCADKKMTLERLFSTTSLEACDNRVLDCHDKIILQSGKTYVLFPMDSIYRAPGTSSYD